MDEVLKWLATDVPAGMTELIVRVVKVFVLGFLILQAKEYFDAGMFDTLATSTDALLVAASVLVVDMIRMAVFRRGTPKTSQARR